MARNIIAILRGIKPNEVEAIGEAIVQEGISLVEIPLNSPKPFESIRKLANVLSGVAKVGAGTVLTPQQVISVAEAGGEIVVSPDCNPEVVAATKAAGMESYPGVVTPTECFTALRHGADGLKLFPSSLVGIEGFKAFSVVLPTGTKCYAVGGAGPDNFGQWLRAGITGFGIGSAIYKPGDQPDSVRIKARKIVQAYDAAIQT